MANFDGCVLLQRVRLSFPNIAVPRAPQGSEKKRYSADFILQPNDPNYAKLYQLVQKVAQDKWPKIAAQVLAALNAERKRRCYGNGDERMNDKYEVLNGYKGMVYVSAARNEDKGMPQIIGADNQPINEAIMAQAEARKLYGGCFVNVVVKPWAYDNTFGRGMSCDLVAIQFCEDGPPFGEGVTDASAMFAGASVTPSMPGAAPGMPGMAPHLWPGTGAPQMPGLPFPGAVPLPPPAGSPFPMPMPQGYVPAAPQMPGTPNIPW